MKTEMGMEMVPLIRRNETQPTGYKEHVVGDIKAVPERTSYSR